MSFAWRAAATSRAQACAPTISTPCGFGLARPTAGCDALSEAEEGIIAHMNADHGAALAAIATRLLGLPRPEQSGAWVMTGIDPEGFDLRAGARLARAGFTAPVRDSEAARAALVALTRKARNFSLLDKEFAEAGRPDAASLQGFVKVGHELFAEFFFYVNNVVKKMFAH